MAAWIWVVLAGCSGGGEAPRPATAPTPAPAPAVPPVPAVPAVPAWKILAPSPLELEADVRKAGVADSLADLVPAEVPAMPPADEKDRVAFRTGVVFAHTLLGGRAAEKAKLVANVQGLRDGMAAIGTGAGLLSTMDKAVEALKNDTASREDFLTELDAEVRSSVPEEGWGPADTTGPMLQAGAWLAGTNLVAKAVVRKGDAAAAQALLHHPEVADFFLKYLASEQGSAKAGSMGGKVSEGLRKLKAASEKPELGLTDAEAIAAVTGELLQLL